MNLNNIKSVLLIDNNEIDNFVNCKLLQYYGVVTINSFKNVNSALYHLKETTIIYQLILIEICLPVIDGFEFIDKFNELELHKAHGTVCLFSASLNPLHKTKALERNVKFIEKPLTIEKILMTG